MHLLGIPVIVLQVICAVHALKTARAYWWLWIILLLPGIVIVHTLGSVFGEN